MEAVNCCLCGSNEARIIYAGVPDLQLGRREVVATFVRCAVCGLVYQNPRPSPDEMRAHYTSDYAPYCGDTSMSDRSGVRWRLAQYGMAKRWRFVTRWKRSGRLLDVGCATGEFLLGADKASEWELYGLDTDVRAIEIARRQHLKVRRATVRQAGFSDDFFDAVTLWDVLEHLHDPLSDLRAIWRILKPGGIVVVRVPNGAGWDARLFGPYWAGLDAPRHLYAFTRQHLERILRTTGFQLLDLHCRSGSYVRFVQSIEFLLAARDVPAGLRKMAVNLLGSPVTRAVFAPLFYLLGLTPNGPSILAVARKPKDGTI